MKVIALTLMLAFAATFAAAVDAADAASFPGTLRERVPTDALAYVRVPGPWALILAQQGPGMGKALASPENAQALEDVRLAVITSLDAMEGKDRSPLMALLLGHLVSPLEAVAMMVPVQGRPQPVALVSAELDLENHAALNALLRELETTNPQVSVLSELQPGGLGVVSFGGMAIALDFDAESGLLSAVVGTGLSKETVATLIALPENSEHPMLEAEARVDDTGLGLFAWVNAQAALPFAQLGMAPEQLLLLEQWGLLKANAVSLGIGTANGKGHTRLAIDVPRSGLLELVPVVDRRVELNAVGDPGIVGVLGGLDADLFERMAAFMEKTGDPKMAEELRTGLAEAAQHLGFSLTEVLQALGPTLVGFVDDAGEYAALEIRDARRLAVLLRKMEARENISIEKRKLAGKTIFHMTLKPSVEEEGSTDPYLAMVADGSTAHIYWVEDNGYLVFGQVPQALADRYRKRPKRSINASLQINEGGYVDGAALLLSARLGGVPRITYYYYLQTLQSFSDLAGANIDLFALPSALELGLPEDGALGLSLEMSDSTLALHMSYDSTPLDALVVPDASMIAIIGIAAAVAIPAYQDYQTRTVVAGVVGSTMESVRGYHGSTGKLPGPQAALSAGPMSDNVSSLTVNASGAISIEFAGPAPVAGQTLEIQPELKGGTIGGYACTGGDLVKKYLPKGC